MKWIALVGLIYSLVAAASSHLVLPTDNVFDRRTHNDARRCGLTLDEAGWYETEKTKTRYRVYVVTPVTDSSRIECDGRNDTGSFGPYNIYCDDKKCVPDIGDNRYYFVLSTDGKRLIYNTRASSTIYDYTSRSKLDPFTPQYFPYYYHQLGWVPFDGTSDELADSQKLNNWAVQWCTNRFKQKAEEQIVAKCLQFNADCRIVKSQIGHYIRSEYARKCDNEYCSGNVDVDCQWEITVEGR